MRLMYYMRMCKNNICTSQASPIALYGSNSCRWRASPEVVSPHAAVLKDDTLQQALQALQ